MKELKFSLVSLFLMTTGCAGMNGPCGHFARNAELTLYREQLKMGKCRLAYTFTNKSDEKSMPAIATRILDNQGKTLGQDNLFFDIVDPGESQKKTGGLYDCGIGEIDVIRSNFYYPYGSPICGVAGKIYIFDEVDADDETGL